MNTSRFNLPALLRLKKFRVYLPFAYLFVLCCFLVLFTLQTGVGQVLKQLGLHV